MVDRDLQGKEVAPFGLMYRLERTRGPVLEAGPTVCPRLWIHIRIEVEDRHSQQFLTRVPVPFARGITHVKKAPHRIDPVDEVGGYIN